MAIQMFGPIEGEVSTVSMSADNNYHPLTGWIPISSIGAYTTVVRMRWQTGDSIVESAYQVCDYDQHDPGPWAKSGDAADSATPETNSGYSILSSSGYYWIRFGVNVRNDSGDDGVWNRVGFTLIVATTE